jgi:hypothetical protein
MQINLSVQLTDSDLQHMIQKFHFNPDELEKIRAMYLALAPLVDARAYYSLEELHAPEPANAQAALAIVTLGNGPDQLMDLYMERELLTEAYILDCLGMELLLMAYRDLVFHIQQITQKRVVKLSFLGDEYALEYLPEVFEKTQPKQMSYTKELQLIPSKSVSLVLPLEHMDKKTAGKDVCNICTGCQNKDCVLRSTTSESKTEPAAHAPISTPHTYGYMQIFRKS